MGSCGGTAVAFWNAGVAGIDPVFCLIIHFSSLLLASVDEPSLLSRLGGQVYVWGSVAVGLGLVIFVHELGHFLAAKLFGVKVEKFYVGFDVPIAIGPIRFPRTLGKFRYGETEYGIGIIPLGGYVKMLGQDDDPRNMQEENQRIRKKRDQDDPDDEDLGDTELVPRQALDPRSYPAKTVGQRMVIISAGVVMNVITGVLFAAFAYGILGVDYAPAVVGAVSPGDPAFAAGIEPGGRVLAVDDDPTDPQMHFSRMTIKVLTHGMSAPETPVKLTIEYPDGIRNFEVMTTADPWEPERRIVGISPPAMARLGAKISAEPGTAVAELLGSEDADAEIIAVDGEPLTPNPVLGVTLNDRVAQRLLQRPEQSVTLTLRRNDDKQTTRDVVIPPRPKKSLGIELGISSVVTLVEGGPAKQAGMQVGDEIISIEGIETLSAFRLPNQINRLNGPVRVTVKRKSGSQTTEHALELEPVEPTATLPPFSSPTGKIAIYSLGFAYYPTQVITYSAVEEIQVGDLLTRVSVRWPDGVPPVQLNDPVFREHVARLEKGWDAGDQRMLSSLIELLQRMPTGTELQVFAENAGDQKVVEARVNVAETDAFWADRGIVYAPVVFTHQADSFGHALALGWREGKWKLAEVGQFLRLLFTGKVSRHQVGGPLKIANIAAMQAERGWAPLLLFLTLLSMNLAILNFLPIPALDGGHMMFLIAEAVLGRPVDEQLQMKLTMVGVLALLSLMIFVFANDILTWR